MPGPLWLTDARARDSIWLEMVGDAHQRPRPSVAASLPPERPPVVCRRCKTVVAPKRRGGTPEFCSRSCAGKARYANQKAGVPPQVRISKTHAVAALLEKHGPMTNSEIVGLTESDAGAVSFLLRSLERQGRAVIDADRRWHLATTKQEDSLHAPARLVGTHSQQGESIMITEKTVTVGHTLITLIGRGFVEYPPGIPVYTAEDGHPLSAQRVFDQHESDLRAAVEEARGGGFDFHDICPVVCSLMEPKGREFARQGGATDGQIASEFERARDRHKISYATLYYTHPVVAARLRDGALGFDLAADIVDAAPDGSWAWTVVIFGGLAHVFRLSMKAGKSK